MVDAMWSQVAVKEIEDRVDKRMNQFEGELTSIHDMVRGLSLQIREMVQIMQRNQGQNKDNYQAPTRFTWMNMCEFTREDVMGWISKCQKFSSLDGTPEGNKVVMTSIAMDEQSYQWFQAFEESRDGKITWQEFVEAIKMRFCSLYDHLVEELVRLK